MQPETHSDQRQVSKSRKTPMIQMLHKPGQPTARRPESRQLTAVFKDLCARVGPPSVPQKQLSHAQEDKVTSRRKGHCMASLNRSSRPDGPTICAACRICTVLSGD